LLTVQNPAKQFISRRVQSFHTSSKSFYKAQYGLVDEVLWQIIPYCLQDFLRLVDGIIIIIIIIHEYYYGGAVALLL